jgi:capsule polysaccharide export protein KpsE/RkpR
MSGFSDPARDLVVIIVRRWKTVALAAVLGTALAIGYALISQTWYAATLTVVPSQKGEGGLAASLASRLPDALAMTSTDVQRIEAVLNSVSVLDSVIDKFKLKDHYGDKSPEGARNALRAHCWTSLDRKASLVSLTCEDTSPARAREMASYFGQVGNQVFSRISASSAREERRFLETQVVKAKKDVDETSQKLRAFQEKNRIIDLPEQSKAVISAMASIQGDMISKQLELSYLNSFAGRGESNVLQLQQQISIMQQKLRQLEEANTMPSTGSGAGSGSGASSGVFFPNAMTVPALRFELEELVRDEKIRETVYFLMTQRYELAKIDEARDTATFQILDEPTEPTVRYRPKRKQLAMFGFAGGVAFACLLIVLPVWWRRRVGTTTVA